MVARLKGLIFCPIKLLKLPYPHTWELVHFHNIITITVLFKSTQYTRAHSHTHVFTKHTHVHIHPSSRCEPKCIPIQFINCGCNITSHGSCKRCAPEGSCNPCVPIGSCRCICCYGPDPIDSDDHNNVAGDEKEDTVINCKDGVWKYVCFKNPTKEVELCISSPEPATRSDSSSPKQETPLLEGSSITMYGSDGGKAPIRWSLVSHQPPASIFWAKIYHHY